MKNGVIPISLLVAAMLGVNCERDTPPPDISAKPLQAPAGGAAPADALSQAYGLWRGQSVEGVGPLAVLFAKQLGSVTLDLSQGHLVLSGPSSRASAPGPKATDSFQAARNALVNGDNKVSSMPLDTDYRIIGVNGSQVSIAMGAQMAKVELREPNTLAFTDLKQGFTVVFSRGLAGK
jgi:hypothetical protein